MHTHCLSHYIPKLQEDTQATAPSINTSEASLNKAQCNPLAQPGTKKSNLHNPSPLCYLCNTQDTRHLFTCAKTADSSGFVD